MKVRYDPRTDTGSIVVDLGAEMPTEKDQWKSDELGHCCRQQQVSLAVDKGIRRFVIRTMSRRLPL
jgi:hypothetical protein